MPTTNRSSTNLKTRSSRTSPARSRFFVEGVFESGDLLTLTGADAHKIVDVLRKHSGDTIEIVDSTAQSFEGELQIERGSVRARLGERRNAPAIERLRIAVAQGIPKGQKMDFVVEKLTELGVAQIVPLRSERVVARASATKIGRWRRLAKSAAAQCGRDRVPEVTDEKTLTEMFAAFANYDRVLLPWELAEYEPARDVLPQLLGHASSVLVLIGPEGGFSHSEAEHARRAGAREISLGPRILRTETAALVTVSWINYVLGV